MPALSFYYCAAFFLFRVLPFIRFGFLCSVARPILYFFAFRCIADVLAFLFFLCLVWLPNWLAELTTTVLLLARCSFSVCRFIKFLFRASQYLQSRRPYIKHPLGARSGPTSQPSNKQAKQH
uniref:Transmembrane protein n=1 Tax=Trypanosoma vivax (strain Y486) TaxID=1055687 RepID=G0UBR6_TRYVY|nr:hypothetical protein TVY486_1107480 [Trypanosoma vivax Y486]